MRRAGGFPLALAPMLDPDGRTEELEAVLDRVDGLVLTGGDDFMTEGLGLGPTHASAEMTEGSKQAYDLALTRLALERDLPILGICYGLQCLGLAEGATLWQDLLGASGPRPARGQRGSPGPPGSALETGWPGGARPRPGGLTAPSGAPDRPAPLDRLRSGRGGSGGSHRTPPPFVRDRYSMAP